MNKFLFLFFLIFIFSYSKGNTRQVTISQDTIPKHLKNNPSIKNKMTDKDFINKFSEIGYFDYTPKEKLKLVQDCLINHFNGDKVFFTEYNRQPPYQFYDSRFYNCGDGEELYEEGGVIALIKEMQPFLNKIGVSIIYENDSYINNLHTIDVNGTTYILAQGSMLMWGETIQKYAEMIDTELEKQNSKERLYLLSYENEYMVFMIEEQYKLVCKYFSPDKRPLTVSDWTTKTLNEMNNLMN